MNLVKAKLNAVATHFNHADNFFDVVRPFYYMAKLFGYSPFTLPQDASPDTSQQLTSYDVLISITTFAFYFFLLYTQLCMEKLYSHGVLVIDVAEDILLFYLTCVSILSTAMLLLFRRHVWGLVSNIYKIDSKMASIGIDIPFKKHHQFVVAHIFIFLLIRISGMIYTCVHLQKHYDPAMKSRFNCWHACLVYFYGIGAFTTTMSYYYLSLLSVYSRLQLVNQYIKNTFINSTKLDSKEIDQCLIVRQISEIYDGLCDVVEIINFCFSFQVMALATACFGYIVFCIFTMYKAITLSHLNDNVFLRNLVLNLVWNFYYNLVAFCIIYVGSNLSYQGHKTGALIHKAINNVKDVKLIDQLRLFSQQLQHRTPVATCGLFPFDWTLLYSTFAASVTYLIILIQFDSTSTAEKAFAFNHSQHHRHGH